MTGYEGSKIEYDFVIERNIMVPMRDGVRLAMDVYRPALNGKPVEGRFPTILERTPYDKARIGVVENALYFTKRGYVVAYMDVRGRFGSEDDFVFMGPHEATDGYDTVEWIAQQPWSDGQVGTIGYSYSTSTQEALAVINPPHLKAQFHGDGSVNYYRRLVRHGGAFTIGVFLPYALAMAMMGKEAAKDRKTLLALEENMKNIRKWIEQLPLKKGSSPLKHAPSYEKWYLDLSTHCDYDQFWKENPGINRQEYIDHFKDVPVYLQTSWYGHHAWANCWKYVELSKRHETPKKLLIGPGVHTSTHVESWSGEVDFGPEAPLYNWNDLRLKFFDHFLKGMHTDIMDTPPIKIFVMGGGDGRRNLEGRMNHGGRWRFENEWPLSRTKFTPYYLDKDGSLRLERPPANSPSSSYTFNPKDPVITIGGQFQNPFFPAMHGLIQGGAFDQRGRTDLFLCRDTLPLSARSDVLVFYTDPLTKDIEVTGPLEVNLWASSSAVDTDFTAKLIDQYPPNEDYPDGYALNLADSIIRARYRNGFEKQELMKPGEIYKLTIDFCSPTSNLFKEGHRIRLDISSSNFPQFDVNPNTGEPLGKSRTYMIAHNKIYHDVEHPSHIVLPIIRLEK
jgi:putative CocE/NonD family hydrolase